LQVLIIKSYLLTTPQSRLL